MRLPCSPSQRPRHAGLGPTRPPIPASCAARYAIIAHVVHLVNRDYLAMCYDYYTSVPASFYVMRRDACKGGREGR